MLLHQSMQGRDRLLLRVAQLLARQQWMRHCDMLGFFFGATSRATTEHGHHVLGQTATAVPRQH